MEDEQQLDFTAAEGDWKSFAEKSEDKVAGQLSLADFYHRRLRPLDEIKVLSAAAGAPPDASENLTPASRQRSWRAVVRIFRAIPAQGVAAVGFLEPYPRWSARHPQKASRYPPFV